VCVNTRAINKQQQTWFWQGGLWRRQSPLAAGRSGGHRVLQGRTSSTDHSGLPKVGCNDTEAWAAETGVGAACRRVRQGAPQNIGLFKRPDTYSRCHSVTCCDSSFPLAVLKQEPP
jgi:hypothetical protein